MAENEDSILKFFWFVIFIFLHIIDMGNGFNRREQVISWALLYFMVPTFAWLISYMRLNLSSDQRMRLDLWGMMLLFGFLSWGLPWMRALLFRLLPGTITLYFDSLIVFFPMLPLLFILNPELGSEWTQTIGTLYLIAWAVLFTANFIISMEAGDVSTLTPNTLNLAMPQLMQVWRPISMVYQGALTTWEGIKERIGGVLTGAGDIWQRQIEYAIDPTARTVEESNAKKVGIFVSALQRTGGILYVGDEVSVFTDIEARLLDEQDDINVNVACVANLKSAIATKWEEVKVHEKENIVGEVIPQEKFALASLDRQAVDCRWEHLRIPGSYQLESRIDFDFHTLAYMPVYFTSRSTLQQYLKDEALGKDVPVELDTIQTTHTSGPMAITLSMGQGTIGVSPEVTEFTLAVSVDNKWSGTAKQMKRFALMIPKEFSLKRISDVSEKDIQQIPCDALQSYYNRPLCEDEVTKAYHIPLAHDEVKHSRVYRMYLNLDDPNRFLGSAQFLKRNINLVAEYNYQFAPRTTITLNPSNQERNFSAPVMTHEQPKIQAP